MRFSQISTTDAGSRAYVGSLPSLKQIVKRAKAKNFPPLPASIAAMNVIPEPFLEVDGVNWLVTNEVIGDGRMIIFASPRSLRTLASCSTWLCDGTFSVAPRTSTDSFQQLYTVHALVGDRVVVPLVYCLLSHKNKQTYDTMWNTIFENLPNDVPRPARRTIICDLESGTIASLKRYADVEHQTCFFHLTQANWRAVQASGLSGLYKADQEFALKVRMLPALAFVPPDEVEEVFGRLVVAEMPPAAAPLVRFFRRHYIDGRGGPGRPAAFFPPSLWSARERTLTDGPRTTNGLEAWHRRINTLLAAHSGVWAFVAALQQEEASSHHRVAQAEMGVEVNPMKAQDKQRHARIKTIVADWGNRNEFAFLRGIARNF